MGLKLMQGLKIQDGWHILYNALYEGFKSTNSVRIGVNQAEETKYKILIPFE